MLTCSSRGSLIANSCSPSNTPYASRRALPASAMRDPRGRGRSSSSLSFPIAARVAVAAFSRDFSSGDFSAMTNVKRQTYVNRHNQQSHQSRRISDGDTCKQSSRSTKCTRPTVDNRQYKTIHPLTTWSNRKQLVTAHCAQTVATLTVNFTVAKQ